jgi:5-methylcytosine-specific restriction enzyme subunit McrC
MNPNRITVFEYESIRTGDTIGGNKFEERHLNALVSHFERNSVPYYSLIRDGIKFNQYVGVIQVGNIIIEVLPKADRADSDSAKWQKVLIGILRAVSSLKIESTNDSLLNIRPNSILDLYFDLFIREVEYLLHNGILKQYRRKQGNLNKLRGKLQFSKHIQENIVHQERFYVDYSNYDYNHKIHYIIYKTIMLLKNINTNIELHSRIATLLLNFPEMPDIKISESLFQKINLDRKSQLYKKALEISKMLLLHYHPNLRDGRENVMALMFDMNILWEKFVFVSLKKNNPELDIKNQFIKSFWKPHRGRVVTIRPDIVINKSSGLTVVLDTKWKNLDGLNPSSDDLRQMYVYADYFKTTQTALVYPGSEDQFRIGFYYNDSGNESGKKCHLIPIKINSEIAVFQQNISDIINELLII